MLICREGAIEGCVTDLYPSNRTVASTSLKFLLRSLDLEQLGEQMRYPQSRSVHALTLYFTPGVVLPSSTLNRYRRLVYAHALSSHATQEPSDDPTHLGGCDLSFYLALLDDHGQPRSPGLHVLPVVTGADVGNWRGY